MDPRKQKLIETIRNNIIGDDNVVDGPFGPRRVTYADYTASGRSIRFIEDYIRDEVMPMYANTHTVTSGTGRQTTQFRDEARQIIKESVGADERDALIFTGSGTTGAIAKLIDVLNLRLPCMLNEKYNLESLIPANERPVVFIGPYEHHSNELPWRESICDVVTIQEDADGRVDTAHLEAELKKYQDRPMRIGSFSAASNVTGIGSDTRAIASLLHKYDALSFWDFAAAGPYVQIEMNMADDEPDGHLIYKDAVFISPHKFIGGPGTPGILVAKKHLFKNRVPATPGGGTVMMVSNTDHTYLDDIEHREEGGTPAIIESIRAGLVFQLKQAVGVDAIREREHDFTQRAIERWSKNPNITILGNPEAWRLSIVSFLVGHGNRRIHHNLINALLNDLFGIQSRGGCSCAGPYGHRLLGISDDESELITEQVIEGCDGIKPGWIRVNFNYFISETAFDYIVKAVDFVATHASSFMHLYDFCPQTGNWTHKKGRPKPTQSLMDISYRSGKMSYRSSHTTEPEWLLEQYLKQAQEILNSLTPPKAVEMPKMPTGFEALRWFVLPSDAAAPSGKEPHRR